MEEVNVPEGGESREETVESTPQYDPRQHKHKVKIYDKEEEWDYDTLIRAAQKGHSSDEKWRETKEMADLVESFKKDPWAIVEKAGKDRYQYAEDLMNERLQYISMTPEQKEALRMKTELDEWKRKAEEGEKTQAQIRLEAAKEKVSTEVDTDIAGAVKELGFKPTPRIVARIAEVMLANLNKEERMSKGKEGYEIKKLSAKEALSRVKDDLRGEISDYISGLEPSQALEILPKKLLDAIRSRQVDRVREQDPYSKRTTNPEPTKAAKKALSTDDWFNNIEKKLKN